MKNKQVLPFIRNEYYSGKMLSSSDFILEQNYNGNKRRFINQMMYGSGIVCGLSVYNLDDLSLMIDSGIALDSYGREIVIEETVIQKFTAIDGFEDMETECASLCINYDEKPIHAVYGMSQGKNDYEYNHVNETFRLYLVDRDKIEEGYQMESEFLLHGNLVDNEEYLLELSVPAIACMGKYVKILLKLTKKSCVPTRFEYKGTLQMPEFTSVEGSNEVLISMEDSALAKGESIVQEIWVKVQSEPSESASIILKPDSVQTTLNGENIEYDRNLSLTVIIADVNPRELVDRELRKTSLEMRNMGGSNDYIRLADITFKRNENGAVIENVREDRVKRYIEVPSDGAIRNEYLGYYAMYSPVEKSNKTPIYKSSQLSGNNFNNNKTAGGIFEIPLGKGAKKGEIFYSGEILHGLGKGDVYVDIGYECIEADASMGRDTGILIYGVSGIFKGNSNPSIEAAVKVMKEKGTFIAGVRFIKDYRNIILRCHWSAVKISDGNVEKSLYPNGNSYITTDKPTIVLAKGETCFFPVKFVNMESCRLCYELSEERSGEISDTGVYTAPQKSGVYEIRIYCENNPFMCTYAYAVVK